MVDSVEGRWTSAGLKSASADLIETIEQKTDQNAEPDEQLADVRRRRAAQSGLLFADLHVGLLEQNLVNRMNDAVNRVDVRTFDVCVDALPFEQDLRALRADLDLASQRLNFGSVCQILN